ncbi:MFS transporter [Cryptosporangium aurantiacum]|uniref:Sugar phosphate permease n=1 Tax=Cryptosporangium aurantiacum TaxID=134849 RepID=A0A1M7QEI5_9ACTN|nr:MFS transporter [Cryptosporangium aurantiacum]SHN29349.1 Sugar phosphate permease [Cryptosporangium aurantiacum]
MVLAAGVAGMTAGCAFLYGLPYLLPRLRADGLSLTEAAVLVACPSLGLLATLVVWGALADRYGERGVIGLGLAGAGVALLVAAAVSGPIALGACLVVGGAAAGSVNAASGRLILGWFGAAERGLAMGIRQMAQPLGVAVAAVAVPVLSESGRAPALVFLAAACLVTAVLIAVVVRDPARVESGGASEAGSPYRTPMLWRLHGSGALLVFPQFAVATFGLVFLVDVEHWDAAQAGRLLAVAAFGGAAARLMAGWWSDRAGSRTGPMRVLAGTTGVVVALLAAGAAGVPGVAVTALVAAAVVSVSTNGLSFTAVAEYAGPGWAGRALGIHNTGQNAVAALTAPVLGAVVTHAGYPVAFASAACAAALAVAVVPTIHVREPQPVA